MRDIIEEFHKQTSMSLIELWRNIYIRKIFDFADIEGKGYLTLHEYKIAMIIIFGNKPTKREKYYAFEIEKNGKLSIKIFMKLMEHKIKYLNIEEYVWEMFQEFDLKSKGYLELEDLLRAQENVLPHLNTQISNKVSADTEMSKYGRMSYRKFLKIINKK